MRHEKGRRLAFPIDQHRDSTLAISPMRRYESAAFAHKER